MRRKISQNLKISETRPQKSAALPPVPAQVQPGASLPEQMCIALQAEHEYLRKMLTPPLKDAVHAVHEARKATKRARAICRLATAGAERFSAQQVRRFYRNIARLLAPYRDRDIISPALEQLYEDGGPYGLKQPFPSPATIQEYLRDFAPSVAGNSEEPQTLLRELMSLASPDNEQAPASLCFPLAPDAAHTLVSAERLATAAESTEPHPASHGGTLESLCAVLTQCLAEFNSAARLAPYFPSDPRALVKAFVRGYRQARRSMRRAKEEGAPTLFHEWRKRAKDHYYQCCLLEPLAPKFFKPRIKRLDDLTEEQGLAQDLFVLHEAIQHALTLHAAANKQRDAILCTVLKAEEALRRKRYETCLDRGGRVFQKRPRTLKRQLLKHLLT